MEGSSEQREVATAFNDMTARLARALRAQREFVANASHQLRTPLTGLRLRLEAAALKSHDPEVERELVAAERETERLARLLTELLMLARERERPEPERLSAGGGGRGGGASAGRGRRRARGTGCRASGEGAPVVAATDADLAVILDNLIENALNYSPAGTAVTIEWGVAGETAWVAVLDEGPGSTRTSASASSSASTAARPRAAERPGPGSACRWWRRWRSAGTARCRSCERPEGGTRAELRLPLQGTAPAQPSPDPQLDDALPGRS